MRILPSCLFLALLFIVTVRTAPDAQPRAPKKLTMKNPAMASFDFNSLPRTAPTDSAAAHALAWPDLGGDFDLKTAGLAQGKYQGPDGGKVSVWKTNNWQWYRRDGYLLWRGPSMLVVKRADKTGLKISHWLKDHGHEYVRRSEIVFADGSSLTRWYNKHYKQYVIKYRFRDRAYLMIRPRSILPEYKRSKHYDLHYKKQYEHYVDIFTESHTLEELRSLLKQTFAAQNKDRVPVLFFETLDEYAGFLQEKNRPIPGGRGSSDRVVVCCAETYNRLSSDPGKKQQLIEKSEFNLMAHEMTHHILAKACLSQEARPRQPEDLTLAFNEGIAEWATSTLSPRYRAVLFKRNYARIDSNRFPQKFSQINDRGARKAFGYAPMFWLWYYVEQTQGRAPLKKYYQQVCRGTKAADAARSSFGYSLEELFNRSLGHFKEKRKQYEARYAEWAGR